MTINQKRDFITKFDEYYNTLMGWGSTLIKMEQLNLCSEEEKTKLMRLVDKFISIPSNKQDNNYILFINLVYEKIKNHTFNNKL